MLVPNSDRTADTTDASTDPQARFAIRPDDPQLDRIRRLASFALNIAGATEPEEVLTKARHALLEQFELDAVSIVHVDYTRPVAATLGGNTTMLSDKAWTELRNSQGVTVMSAAAPAATALLEIVDSLGAGPTGAAQGVAWIPVRPRAGDLVLLCGWTAHPSPINRNIPQAEDIPFLELFGEHVKRAIDSAEFTVELRRQKAELADSNCRLQASLHELERAQAQLVQAQKLEALGKLTSGIAHDFNNLLTVIVSHAHLVQCSIETPSQSRADLNVVVDAAMRAAEITQRLLAFSRQNKSQRGAVDLNAIAIAISQTMRRWISGDIVVELDLDPSVGRVRADANDLEQILTNLVNNAREAMPQGGKLTLETRHATHADKAEGNVDPSASMIALCVRDSGIGMDAETRRQLFEPFFTTKPSGTGSGLGLSTVYGLVAQNEGQIHVQSTVGQGSCFTVLLPSADGLCGADLHAPVTTARRRVLIVEDEQAIRRMIGRVLRKADFDVVEAGDGEQALDIARQLPDLDLLITDVSMPFVSGPELVGQLRAFVPRLRVIFMSGYTFDRLDVSTLDASLEYFLAKPFTPDQLQAAIDTAFAS